MLESLAAIACLLLQAQRGQPRKDAPRPMNTVRDAIARTLEAMAGRAAEAHARLATQDAGDIEHAIPGLDRDMRALYEAADATRRYLTLYREPVHALYDPIAAARAQSAHLVGPSLASMMAKQFTGDSEQVTECLRLVVDNARLETGGAISLAVHPDGHPPRIEVHINQGATLPGAFQLTAAYTIDFDDFSERWNGATAGGRIEAACGGLAMNLRGTRRPPKSCAWANDALAPVSPLVRILTPWRGAIGHFEHGSGADEETRALYAQVLEKVMSFVKQSQSRLRNGMP